MHQKRSISKLPPCVLYKNIVYDNNDLYDWESFYNAAVVLKKNALSRVVSKQNRQIVTQSQVITNQRNPRASISVYKTTPDGSNHHLYSYHPPKSQEIARKIGAQSLSHKKLVKTKIHKPRLSRHEKIAKELKQIRDTANFVRRKQKDILPALAIPQDQSVAQKQRKFKNLAVQSKFHQQTKPNPEYMTRETVHSWVNNSHIKTVITKHPESIRNKKPNFDSPVTSPSKKTRVAEDSNARAIALWQQHQKLLNKSVQN